MGRRVAPFRLIKWLERVGLRRADGVVVLTNRVRDWLIEQRLCNANKIEVIPCCVAFSRFEAERESQPAGGSLEVVYAGSVTGLYMLKEMGRFFKALRSQRPGALFRVLTTASASEAAAVLRQAGLEEADFWIGAVRPAEIPVYMARARLGISFRKATFSQIAASPTKIPEYLAAGLPIVCNVGVGDTDELLLNERVGVMVDSFDDVACAEAARRALALMDEPGIRARCIDVACRRFDLVNVGGTGYGNVYRRLAEQNASAHSRVRP
jgi:glycosyltransferase involved in cell wall biosynthesis